MKRVYLLVAILCAITTTSFGQIDPNTPKADPNATVSTPKVDTPCMKYPDMPAFNSLTLDSVVFNTFSIKKGKPTILVLFSPTCEHCQKMITHMVSAMDSLKGFNIYMFAWGPLQTISEFRVKYGLDKFKNVWMGKDDQFFMPSFYLCRDVPFIAVYDKNKVLAKACYNGLKIDEILESVKK